jgi:hypothetical protein
LISRENALGIFAIVAPFSRLYVPGLTRVSPTQRTEKYEKIQIKRRVRSKIKNFDPPFDFFCILLLPSYLEVV